MRMRNSSAPRRGGHASTCAACRWLKRPTMREEQAEKFEWVSWHRLPDPSTVYSLPDRRQPVRTGSKHASTTRPASMRCAGVALCA